MDFKFRIILHVWFYLYIFILFWIHICILQRFDLHFRSMRYKKKYDFIIIIIIIIIIIQRWMCSGGRRRSDWRRMPVDIAGARISVRWSTSVLMTPTVGSRETNTPTTVHWTASRVSGIPVCYLSLNVWCVCSVVSCCRPIQRLPEWVAFRCVTFLSMFGVCIVSCRAVGLQRLPEWVAFRCVTFLSTLSAGFLYVYYMFYIMSNCLYYYEHFIRTFILVYFIINFTIIIIFYKKNCECYE